MTWMPLAVFAIAFAIVIAAYVLGIVIPESRGQSSVRKRLKWEEPNAPAQTRLLKKPEVMSAIGGLDAVLTGMGGLTRQLKVTLDEADVQFTVGAFLLLCICLLFGGFIAANLYWRIFWVSVGVGVLASLVPFVVVRQMRTRRVRKFEEQLPEAIALISRAMRAGHAFTTGMKMVADEMPEPLGSEFRLLYERQNYGAPLPDALRAFAMRIPLVDARFFVTAVLTQREAGGNLAEVLDRLGAVMRERFRIRREVRVRSAHGRVTAYVLAGMPPVLAAVMMTLNPNQLTRLWTDPLGTRMIAAAVSLQLIGTLIVRKLIRIEY